MLAPATIGSGSRESELVLLCARLVLEDEARERASNLARQCLAWDKVLHWSAYHHVAPLLYHHLQSLAPDDVPVGILDDLRTRYRGIAARNLKLTLELVSLLKALEQAGATGVVWKGPALAFTVYPSPELRTFSDLDIILRRADRHRARAVLNQRGYQGAPGFRRDEDELFREDAQDATMWNPETHISVDLHWGSVARYRAPVADFETLWAQKEHCRFHGTDVHVLEPGVHILALCAHGAKHGPFPWPAAKWVTDIEAYLRTYPPEWWDSVMERAQKEGCLRMLLLGLALAGDILDAPLPGGVSAALGRQPQVQDLVPAIRRRMSGRGNRFTLGERVAFDLAVRERFQDRMAYRVSRLITTGPRDVISAPATSPLVRVPLRLLRLTRTYLLRPRALRTLIRGRDAGGGTGADGGNATNEH
jgi:hypothetical protein